MCGYTSTFPQGFPGGDPFFTGSRLNTHHNISHPYIHGTREKTLRAFGTPCLPTSPPPCTLPKPMLQFWGLA